MKNKLNVAFLGSGKIAIDLLIKSERSQFLNCILVASRNLESEGLNFAKSIGINISDNGISAIIENKENIDIVFDCTSAMAHEKHWQLLKETKIKVIDMTPSGIGKSVVPVVNSDRILTHQNVNMISCGGQASIPLIYSISETQSGLDYVEIVSSIASKSAGPATRSNIDEYIQLTENASKKFSGINDSKVILILNPAEPPISMQTSISFLTNGIEIDLVSIKKTTNLMVEKIKSYVPGYELIVEPVMVGDNRLLVMVKVVGLGDFLPSYAGNLDIINCAAIAVAENFAKSKVLN